MNDAIPSDINILILEDRVEDAELLAYELEKAGFNFNWYRVDTAEAYSALLQEESIDLILADYSLPQFDADEALNLLQASEQDIPFIVVSGAISEELAVGFIKRGAADYLLKDRLVRLGEAVRQAYEQKQLRDAKRETEKRLRESEERYALAAKGANDGLWDWDLNKQSIYFSDRWKELLGIADEVVSNSIDLWLDRVHPKDRESLENQFKSYTFDRTVNFEHEYRMAHQSGEYRWFLTRGVVVRDAHGKAIRLVGSHTDITERKTYEAQLLHNAFHDELTDLPNRALFLDRLWRSLMRNKRYREHTFAVLFLDLDRFKVINDSLGHRSGDQLLIAIARRLSDNLRPEDTMARLGGDEFVILLEEVKELEQILRVVERIQNSLKTPFTVSGHEIFSSVSIGIAMSTTGYERAEDILRDADAAMYRAKSAGVGCYEVFDSDMHTQAMAILHLESDLRKAVANNEIIVHYQPIVDLKTSNIVGFEALSRWHHPTQGIISPNIYISIAEEVGCIIDIGDLVLDQACQQYSRWREVTGFELEFGVSVNLSGKQLYDDRFVEKVNAVLAKYNLAPSNLRLEITESVLMENHEVAIYNLQKLNQLGTCFAMDDFGTGYSSLSYLYRFPISEMKIDRGFIKDMAEGRISREIVQAVIKLGENFDIDVIAEGIETAEQMDVLRQLGCPYGQGYFFSKPLDTEKALEVLGASPAKQAGSQFN